MEENANINLKIDITPSSPYDRFAVEQSLENLFMNQKITFEEYISSLPEDSSMPKATLESISRRRREVRNQVMAMQAQINEINSAINQEMINQGGDIDGMSYMQDNRDEGQNPNAEPNNMGM